MITVMVITDSIKNNEMISSSIIGGFENTACIIAATDISECEQIIRSQKHDIDIFIIQIRMKEKGGRKLAEFIRGFKRYKETPILFITSISQNVVGYSELATYQGYKKENYISTPIRRIDVQGKIGLYLDKIIEDAAEKRNCERVVFLEHDAGETFIEVKSILFAEVQNRTVTLHTESGDYSIKRTSLDTLCDLIGSDNLVRCHKSFALNPHEVKEIATAERRNWLAVFPNGAACPISQTYYSKTRSAFLDKVTR